MKYRHALIGAFASTATAHTWIEQLMVIAPNGTMVGEPGFPRGNVKRGTPGFGDPAMVNLLPSNDRPINQILPTDLMCKSTQTTQTQTNDSPRLQAAAGDNIALRYQENGHVSLPAAQAGKPENRGTVYVYGTTQPREDDAFLSIHRVWNAAGTGGDGRGVLLSTQNYDDGQCYQVNGGDISVTRQKTFSHAANTLMGADLWCQQDIQIPATAPSGQPYTLYWVWDWPTMPGTEGFPDGKQEIYTTCMDVDITSAGQSGNIGTQNKLAANGFVQGQDLGRAAIAAQLADITNPTAVTGDFIPLPSDGSNPSQTSIAPTQITSVNTFPGMSNSTVAPTQVSSTSLPSSASSDSPATSSAPFQSSPHNEPPFSRTRRPRPTVSSFNPDPNHNGRPDGRPDADPNNQPHVNTDLNTATAISNTVAATTTTVIAQAASTVTQVNSIFETVTQTKLETVYVSATANQRRAEATEIPTTTTTFDEAAATDYPSIRACSQTESVYLLRARRPFYILPQEKRPDAGC